MVKIKSKKESIKSNKVPKLTEKQKELIITIIVIIISIIIGVFCGKLLYEVMNG